MTEQDKELQDLRRENKKLKEEKDNFLKRFDLDIKDLEEMENLFKDLDVSINSYKENTRSRVLEEAMKCVCSDREDQYGTPEDSFSAIAKLWTAYYGEVFYPDDVAIMMTLLKIARIKTGRYKDDSYIDAAGYIACAAEIAQSKGW